MVLMMLIEWLSNAILSAYMLSVREVELETKVLSSLHLGIGLWAINGGLTYS